MNKIRAELHVHTVLSPCASIEMIPPLIISEAESKGIDLIAVTDHNTIDNIQAVMVAAENSQVQVLPGIEVQTREEVHSVCIFDSLGQILEFFARIKPSFPPIKNNPDFFGEQFVVDHTGDFICNEERLLISSSNLSLSDLYFEVKKSKGLFIPAHVNRSAYGLLPVLGFFPDDIDIEVVEISKHINPKNAVRDFPQIGSRPFIQSGDAHFLNEIIGFNEFYLQSISIDEILMALFQQNGRKYNNLYDDVYCT